jgi:transcriptional regulator with XRE-family HTH domain
MVPLRRRGPGRAQRAAAGGVDGPAVPGASAAFGVVVRQQRRALGLSQEELASRAGLDRTTIGRVERGEFRVTLDAAEAMALACGVPLWTLLRQAAGAQVGDGSGQTGA